MTQPAWATGPAQPLVLSDGQTVLTWGRILSGYVWLSREDLVADGGIVAGQSTVHAETPWSPQGLGVDGARKLAADLLAAVELVSDTRV